MKPKKYKYSNHNTVTLVYIQVKIDTGLDSNRETLILMNRGRRVEFVPIIDIFTTLFLMRKRKRTF